MPRVPPVTTATVSSGAGMHPLLPGHDAGAPDEARAERGQGDGHAGLEQPVALGLVQGERDRGRRRVGRAVDVEDDLLGRDVQLGGHRVDDPAVGLVGDEEVDVVGGQPGALQGLRGRGAHAAHGVAVDLLALHAQHAGLGVGVQQVGLLAVGAQDEAGEAEVEVAAGDDHGADAVAEEHGGGAVGVVDDAREGLGGADQHDARAAALHERRGMVERVEETGARGAQVDRRRARRAQRTGDLRREAGGHAVGGDGRDEDDVDLVGRAAGVGERVGAGLRGQRGEQLALAQAAALADARAADDPLVARVEHLLEVAVGDDALRQGRADAEDAGRQAATAGGRSDARGTRGGGGAVARRGGGAGAGEDRAHAGVSVRLTRPVRTVPGPSSTKRSTPPARRASSVSRQRTGLSRWAASSARTSTKGAAEPLAKTRMAGGRTGVRSSAAARRSEAGAMSGEWNAPETSRRRVRAPVSSRPASSAASIASSGPESTSWPGALSLATVRPRRSARRPTAWPSPPRKAIIPPGFSVPASSMAAPRSATRPTASSKSRAPAATRAAYSPSEWPAAATTSSGLTSAAPFSASPRRHASHAATEHRNSAGCWKRVPSCRRGNGSKPRSSRPRSKSGSPRYGSS